MTIQEAILTIKIINCNNCKYTDADICKDCFYGMAIEALEKQNKLDDIIKKLEDLKQPCYECRESCNEKCLIERVEEIVKEGDCFGK